MVKRGVWRVRPAFWYNELPGHSFVGEYSSGAGALSIGSEVVCYTS